MDWWMWLLLVLLVGLIATFLILNNRQGGE
jgi:hypothetical protein